VTMKNGVKYNCQYGYGQRTLRDSKGGSMFRLSASSFPTQQCELLDPGVVQVVDGRGNIWNHTRNKYGRRTIVESPDGYIHRMNFSNNGAGWVLNETNARGFNSTYDYDRYGNVLFYTNEMEHLTEYQYGHSVPALRTAVIKGEKAIRVQYTSGNRLKKIIDPTGNYTEFSYDFHSSSDGSPDGQSLPNRVRALTRTDRIDNEVVFEYNTYGDLVKQIQVNPDGLSPTEILFYDPETHRLESTVALLEPTRISKTSYTWDPLGRPTSVTVDPEGGANEPPTADFTHSPEYATDIDLIQFTDTSTDIDSTIVFWQWDFDDGGFSVKQNPTHRYSTVGEYNISLTVVDSRGAIDTIKKTIIVASAIVYVDDNADQGWYDAKHVQTIQEGIDNASEGWTVNVSAGWYDDGDIVIDKTLTLIGEENSVRIEGSVDIYADEVIFCDFLMWTGSVEVHSSNHCVISKNGFAGADEGAYDSGIYLYDSNYIIVSGNTALVLQVVVSSIHVIIIFLRMTSQGMMLVLV